jgi:hypothetical protein
MRVFPGGKTLAWVMVSGLVWRKDKVTGSKAREQLLASHSKNTYAQVAGEAGEAPGSRGGGNR